MIYVIMGVAFVLLAGAAFLFRSNYERKHFLVEKFHFETEKLKVSEHVTAIFLSDLHDNQFGYENKDLVESIKNIKPDIILVGGDMMVCKGQKDISVALKLLEQLSEIAPIYHGNGNHEVRMRSCPEIYGDQYQEYLTVLERLGVRHLADEQCQFLLSSGGCLTISGIDLERCHYRKFVKPAIAADFFEQKLGAAKEDSVQITMVHSPLFLKEAANWGSDLVLSGHFHGGTIRIPKFRGLMSPQFQFFPKYGGGEYEEQATKMIVSRGLGTHSINIRINNRPQLVIIDIIGSKSFAAKTNQ